MEMDKEDRRFIDGKNVDERAVEGTNLAAMDWEEFEHLVRELFEREFASRGGEVKVTQSSSDGGVDAIAFDPDPNQRWKNCNTSKTLHKDRWSIGSP